MALRPSAAQPSALLVLAVVSRVTQAWVRPLVAQQASGPLERLGRPEEPVEKLGQLAAQALASV